MASIFRIFSARGTSRGLGCVLSQPTRTFWALDLPTGSAWTDEEHMQISITPAIATANIFNKSRSDK